MSGGVVTFDTTNSGKPEANTVPLTYGANTLDLSTGLYNTKNFTAYDTLDVKTISGALTISGGENDVNAYLKSAANVKKENTATGVVTLYLGDKAEQTVSDAITLTNASHSGAATVDFIKVNTTGVVSADQDLLKALNATGKPKIDATAFEGAKLTVSDEIKAAKWDLNTGIKVDANDEVKATAAQQTSGNALELVFTAAKDTVDVKAVQGQNAKINVTLNGFDKANDKLTLGSNASAKAAVFTKATINNGSDVKEAAISSDGVLTIFGTSGALLADKNTVDNALLVLNKGQATSGSTPIAGANKWALFTDNDGKTYLLGTGASTNATDDIAIALTGVTSFTVSTSGDATFA